MPPRKKTTSASGKAIQRKVRPYECPEGAAWGGWINIRLDDGQRETATSWMEDNAEHIQEYLNELLGFGMKITLAYDMQHDTYVCSFTGALCRGEEERYTITTRAGSLSDVMALAVWKHVELAGGDYTEFVTTGDNYPTWG